MNLSNANAPLHESVCVCVCVSLNVLLQRHTEGNSNRPSKTRGQPSQQNKQLGVEIKRRVRVCQEMPARRGRLHTYVPKTQRGASPAGRQHHRRVPRFTFRTRLFLSLHERPKIDGKGSAERSARARPLVSNQSHSVGSSSIRGLSPPSAYKTKACSDTSSQGQTVVKPQAS